MYTMKSALNSAEENMRLTKRNRVAVYLPIEIIIHIMEYLPLADRISASQVCRLWYEASKDMKLHKNEVVELHDDLTRPLEVLGNSLGTFLNFVFKEVELGSKMTGFWDRFCPLMESLSLHCCDVAERNFVDILSRCSRLRNLKVNGCRELLMSGRVLEQESDMLMLRKTLVNLRELSLAYNRYLSDALFNRFVVIAPDLEELSLEGCQISFHMGLYKKFYPYSISNSGTVSPSESVLTFFNILQYVTLQAKKIKSLKFGHTLIDNAALSQLVEVPHLQLRTLHLQACDQLNNVGILVLAKSQTSLQELDISHCSRITDHAVLAICRGLHNLTRLNLHCCRIVSDVGIAELAKLTSLVDLNISQCEQITSNGLRKALCSRVNPAFRRLQLTALRIDEDTICTLAEHLPGLTHLDLSFCFNAVTDRSVQAILQHQIWLRSLKISGCDKVTDAGLTGRGLGEIKERVNMVSQEAKASASSWFQETHQGHGFSLGSKAEQEIVNDGKRKQTIQQMFDTTDANTQHMGFSLDRLKGLQELDLCGCSRITDISLKYAFRFLELRHLSISLCQQITYVGVSHLAVNNPSIETLIMSECNSMTDEGVMQFVKCLPRLKHLDLTGCSKLTDDSLKAISENCHSLQYLNISRCTGMNMETTELLQIRLPALHTVHKQGLVVCKKCQVRVMKEYSVPVPPPPPPSAP